MKFKVGDTVKITGGKDKGKEGKIIKVLPEKDRVVVEGVNLYTRHIKPYGDRSGEKVVKPRPLPTANIAILNGEGEPDRIGYSVAKDGSKERVFKKTGESVPAPKVAKE